MWDQDAKRIQQGMPNPAQNSQVDRLTPSSEKMEATIKQRLQAAAESLEKEAFLLRILAKTIPEETTIGALRAWTMVLEKLGM